MHNSDRIQQTSVRAHVHTHLLGERCREALAARLDVKDERGDVAPLTIGIGVMAALALAVGAIITAKVVGKANAISLD